MTSAREEVPGIIVKSSSDYTIHSGDLFYTRIQIVDAATGEPYDLSGQTVEVFARVSVFVDQVSAKVTEQDYKVSPEDVALTVDPINYIVGYFEVIGDYELTASWRPGLGNLQVRVTDDDTGMRQVTQIGSIAVLPTIGAK